MSLSTECSAAFLSLRYPSDNYNNNTIQYKKGGMVQNMKRDPKYQPAGICTNPQEGAQYMIRINDQ